MFAEHVGICDGQVNGAAICNSTQVAPIPAAAIAAPHVNLTVVVDGGLIESFAAERVALSEPMPSASPSAERGSPIEPPASTSPFPVRAASA